MPSIIDMVTTKNKVVKTTTITGESSFVEYIIIEGTVLPMVSVKIRNSNLIYRYQVGGVTAKAIVNAESWGLSMGQVFNKWLRGSEGILHRSKIILR
jgi:hypothetical protein